MPYTYSDIAKMIDHSLLQPMLTVEELEAGCKLASEYDVASVCILPYSVKRCAGILAGSTVKASTTIGFPHGGHTTAIKVAEALQALKDGCQELDMVVNISQVLSGKWDYVRQEIHEVTGAAHAAGQKIKVIFENCYLQDSHKLRLCEICGELNCDWVKTSTGYGHRWRDARRFEADARALAAARPSQSRWRHPHAGSTARSPSVHHPLWSQQDGGDSQRVPPTIGPAADRDVWISIFGKLLSRQAAITDPVSTLFNRRATGCMPQRERVFGRLVMSEQARPYKKNVAGPFYVVDGCCMTCDVPMTEAPDLFAYDESDHCFHCFVTRQPGTSAELRAMLLTVLSAEAECMRYRGRDPDILRRLAEMQLGHLCDVQPPSNIGPVFRNHVTFDAVNHEDCRLTSYDLAVSFQDYLRSLDAARRTLGDRFRYQFTPIVHAKVTASFSFSWFDENYHMIESCELGDNGARWLIHHGVTEKPGSRTVSNQLEKWLQTDGRFCSFRWYSADEWNGSKNWQETAW